MPRIAANGIRTHYISAGDGSDVVMIHGLLSNLSVWHLRAVPALRQRFRLTTYDLRGHGYSELTEAGYSARTMAEDLAGLMDALNIRKASLVGYSFGADIALYMAVREPWRVSKIVALEPGLAVLASERAKPAWPGWKRWLTRLESAGVEVPEERKADVQYLLEQSLLLPDPPLKGFARKRELQVRLIRETSLLRDYQKVDALTLDALENIHAPVLLAFGAQSPLLSSFEPICSRLSNCRSILLPELDHLSMLDMPETLMTEITAFLELPANEDQADGDSFAAAT